MKTLVLLGLAMAAMLSSSNAVEEKKKPKPPATPVLFGGWAAGKTFTYTVTGATAAAKGMTGDPYPVAVPKGIPSYKVGEQVKFTIGKKGELLAPKGLKISFQADGITSNQYVNIPTAKAPTPHFAFVLKNPSTNEPTGGVQLTFYQIKRGKGFSITTTTVSYSLN
jgi:hypothetical protein